MTLIAKELCTKYVDHEGLSSFTASRLIALDKHPGVRPIAIGEISRRIISEVMLAVVADDVREVTGCMQLCAGLEAGCVAGVEQWLEFFRMTKQK